MRCPVCETENEESALACASCGVSPAVRRSPRSPLPPGTILRGGAFSIGRVLGEGGFGITYKGSDASRGCLVAIKEFFPDDCGRQGERVQAAGRWTTGGFEEARQQCMHAGRTLAFLDDPGIVRVHRAFEDNNTAYVVMEFLQGRNLQHRLEEEGPMPEPEALRCVRKVGEALEVAHQVGVLHLDVKPENVIETEDGRLVLIDFDGAREFVAGREGASTRMVTPGYAPLEQYYRQARVGPFTDVYALAAMLYHLTTGKVPLAAPERALGIQLPPPRQLNAGVGPEIDAAITLGMAMHVRQRPQSARALLELLPYSPDTRRITASAPLPRERRLDAHTDSVRTVAFSPRSDLLASGGDDQSVRLWDVASAVQVRCVEGVVKDSDFRLRPSPSFAQTELKQALARRKNAVHSVAFSPDARLLASGSEDGVVRLWNVAGEWEEETLGHHTGAVNSVAFSPSGQILATGGADASVKLWELGRRTEAQGPWTGEQGAVNSLAFGIDGRWLAWGSEDGKVHLWEVPRRYEELPLEGHQGNVHAIAFSPAGKRIASGGEDGTVRVWDHATGRQIAELHGHTSAVNAVAFSRDGRWLASGSADATLRIWDLASRGERRVIKSHTSAVASLAFSSDGRLLASGSWDQTVRLWAVDWTTDDILR